LRFRVQGSGFRVHHERAGEAEGGARDGNEAIPRVRGAPGLGFKV